MTYPQAIQNTHILMTRSGVAKTLAILLGLAVNSSFAQGWQPRTLPALTNGASYSLSAISALDANRIWACGSISSSGNACVLQSTNGGMTWSQICETGLLGPFNKLQMVSATTGFVAGSGLRHTSNGGATWELETNNFPDLASYHSVGPSGWVYGLAAVDATHIWAAGYDGAIAGVIYHRVPERPQGDTNNLNANAPWWLEWAANYRGMYGVSAVDENTAWAVGYAGYLWHTTDGSTWAQESSGTGAALNDVAAVDASTAWVVGDSGTILKTTDGGATWVAQTSDTSVNLKKIAAVSASAAWVVGENGIILATTNGGASWAVQHSGTYATLTGVVAVDVNTAWVCGTGGTLLSTTDGGRGAWPAPTIVAVATNIVGQTHSTTVTLSGTGLRGGGVTVAFGSTAAQSVTWVDTNTLQAITPYEVGTLNVSVANEDGQSCTLSNAITFLPAPVMTAFSPLHGPAAGGYQIAVSGYNLATVTSALFYTNGGGESLPVTVIDSTRVLITVPLATNRYVGNVYLELVTAEGQLDSGYHFQLDPDSGATFAIDSISPHSGPSGTALTVTGIGFATNATLDCANDVTVTNRSTTRLIGAVRSSYSGLYNVDVLNSENDYVTIFPGFLLTSGALPQISAIYPISGSIAGGSQVTILGSNFESSDTVTFDGYQATILSFATNRLIVAAPPHPAGTVSTFVMSSGLKRSAAMLTNAYTYTSAGTPTLTITTPTPGASISNAALLAAEGMALDDTAISGVYYRFNTGGWSLASTTNAWTNWAAPISPAAGTNILQACALDTGGVYSPTTTVSFVYYPSAQLALSIIGQGSLSPAYTNGQRLLIGATYSIAATGSNGYAFSGWSGSYSSPSNVLTFVMRSNATLVATFVQDARQPSVTVAYPKPGGIASNTAYYITLQGTAKDNRGLNGVRYRINSSSWLAAVTSNTWTNWSATAYVQSGTNTLQVYALDAAGNRSLTNTCAFRFLPLAALTVNISGSGALKPALTNGQRLIIGSTNTITATGAAGFVFSNWSGTVSSSSNVLTFVMRSGASLQANFIPNPFSNAAATYQGLFFNTNSLGGDRAGMFVLTPTAKGAYSGKLQLAGKSFSLSGNLSVSGQAEAVIAVSKTNSLRLSFNLDLAGDTLGGTVSNSLWSAPLAARRAGYSKQRPWTNSSAYTLLVAGSDSSSSQPGGEGCGTVKLTALGAGAFSGTLADGAALSSSASVSRSGAWPFYASLYSSSGVVLGWLTFTNEADSDLNGQLYWLKPAGAGSLYPSGFTNNPDALGAAYALTNGRALAYSNALLSLAEGNLSGAFTNAILISAGAAKSTNTSLKLTISPATGLFSGSVGNPSATSPRALSFKGAILQKQKTGLGYFLNSGQSGRVVIQPAP
jgi:photosystem II stability/assembly factor-like uncharacterized protein